MFMADVCCHKNAKLSGLPLRMRLLDDQKGHSAVATVALLFVFRRVLTLSGPFRLASLAAWPGGVCVCALLVFMALCLLITFAASAFHL